MDYIHDTFIDTSDSRTVITEIIKSKVKVNEGDSTQSGINPVAKSITGTIVFVPLAQALDNLWMFVQVLPKNNVRRLKRNLGTMLNTSDSRIVITEIIKSKVKVNEGDSTQSGINPVAKSITGTIVFVPLAQALEQPLDVCSNTSDSRIVITEIIKSKVKVNEGDSTQSGINPVAKSITGTIVFVPLAQALEQPLDVCSSSTKKQHTSDSRTVITEIIKSKVKVNEGDSTHSGINPVAERIIVFVPLAQALERPLDVGSSSTKKQRKKAKKKSRDDAQLPVAVVA
ncbi:hypothetical protein LOK49_LG08G00736 [Camellia lanceoleosa]|uniref:Uncharacterized protein n=1 Tax=Camellia lanceoleosa TaxID=1840588 RepID=A0ACC0GUV4_9ERIC|nr:hypothetical protein LOK49_LG08G00736 [Camellia lanceoleosa]